jgi:hypothetical protein
VISGGEPTAHPQFREFTPDFKALFDCQRLSLLTNGYKVIKYANLLHFFDEIFISHFKNNQKAVEFILRNFKDGRPPGPTLHVCTARRAINPRFCSRAYHIKYIYGKLYPCCAIPNGCEDHGILLTPNWRTEIRNIPLPCEYCCFAEEQFPTIDIDVVDIMAFPKRTKRNATHQNIWPNARPEIEIYGVDLDSWIGRKALIRCYPTTQNKRLRIRLESYAPVTLHPITIMIQDESRRTVQCQRVKSPGPAEVQINFAQIAHTRSDIIFTLLCDTTFIPRQFNLASPDTRELGIRIVSLWYE